MRTRRLSLAAALVAAPFVLAAPDLGALQERPPMDRFLEECGEPPDDARDEGGSRLSDRCIPLAEIPERPRPILELGEPFLGTGTLGRGFTLPTGAVWQPALMAFGTLRTAVQGGYAGSGDDRVELLEAVSRFDFFGNLYLTQTERILVGIRPLDQGGLFTGYTVHRRPELEPGEDEFVDRLNGNVRTLFMEGDLGEIFPNLDNDDSAGLDLYFGVGRQPVGFQDGMLVAEDALDMLGLTRANLKIGGLVNTRITGAWAWGEVTRDSGFGNFDDEDARMFGLFTEVDTRSTTLEIDAAYVTGSDLTGDGIHAGLGDIRRIGRFNNTLRVLVSAPVGDETPFNRSGVLVHDQFSWTPHHSHDFWYIGAFAGIGHYRSAVRGPSSGGPAGATGLLFAAPGIGRVGAPLDSRVDDSVGAALGHQMFFDHTRKQLVVEVAGRLRTRDPEDLGGGDGIPDPLTQKAAAAGARFQSAMGRRFVFVLDAFGIYDLDLEEPTVAGRLELVLKL